MELKHLRYFRTIVEAGGLTKAAGLLQTTPGTLSKSIRQLESDLRKSLFVRVGRSLELTDEGRMFYALSEPLVEEHARLMRTLDSSTPPKTAAKALRIASYEPFTTHTLGAVVELGLHDVPMRVVDIGVGKIERAVIKREADVGVTYVPFPDRALRFKSLGKIEFGIFGLHNTFLRRAFDSLPFAIPVAVINEGPVDILGLDSWPYDLVPRQVKYRLTSLESALELARRGLCVVFIPTFIAALHNRTVRRQLRLRRIANPPKMKPVRQTVHLVTLVEREEDETIKRLGAALRKVIQA